MVDDAASLIAMPPVDVLTIVKVAADAGKTITSSIYMLWPDGRRMWIESQEEATTGSPKLGYRLPVAYSHVDDFTSLSEVGTPHVLTIVKVATDTHKSTTSSVYMLWPDGKRIWISSIEDAVGFPFIWHNLPVKYSMLGHFSLLIDRGTPDVMTITKIVDDEHKAKPQTIYMVWPDGIRVLLTSHIDNPTEPVLLMTEDGQFITDELGNYIQVETPIV